MRLMTFSKPLSFVFATLLLTACGTLQKEAPQDDTNGPGFRYGEIRNGRYVASIGMGIKPSKFSVGIPQARDPYEYSHMWQEDNRDFDTTSVVFGPAALDGTVYRIRVVKKGDRIPADTFKDNQLPDMIGLAEHNYGFPLSKLSEQAISVKGHPAKFVVYEQVIPDTEGELLPYYNKGLYTHAMYFIDYGDYGVALWVQTTTGGGVNAVDKIEQKQMINRNFEPQNYLVNSFDLG